ncbi:MAG: hypothetical protein ACKO3B_13915 [Bacteroidota bacterium]
MEFSDWLISKKIDTSAFQAGDPPRFSEWEKAFGEMHPASFTARYLYQINAVRRKFILQQTVSTEAPVAAKPRPVIRPKTT